MSNTPKALEPLKPSDHPEPRIMSWSKLEIDFINERVERATVELQAENESLRQQLAARVPDGCAVADVGFRWDGERQHHVPKLVVEFDPVPANSPCDAKGWKDRDAVVAMLSAAPSQPAPVQVSKDSPSGEPVAWLYTLEYGSTVADSKVSGCALRYPFGVCGADYLRCNDDGMSYVRETPLYTNAQQSSEPMTDELEAALEALVNRCNNDAGLTNDDAVIAAEAALEQLYKSRIKGKQ